MTRRLGLLALSAAVLFAGGACRSARYFTPPEAPGSGTSAEGMASWYGPNYHGARTASGEIFDQNALTAAHPYWEFGTRVKVTLLSTGRSVVVTINDRFGGHKGRIIDISKGAAERIGLIGLGVGRVRLEVVG